MSFSQSKAGLDSLYKALETEGDSTRVSIYYEIAFAHSFSANDSFLVNVNRGIELARALKFTALEGNGHNNLGIYYSTQSNYAEAIKYLGMSHAAGQSVQDTVLIIKSLNNLSIVYQHQGEFYKALQNQQIILTLCELLKDEYRKSVVLNNMGSIYYDIGAYKKAISFYVKSLEMKEKRGDQKALFAAYSNVGSVYFEIGNYDKAIGYYRKAKQTDNSYNKGASLGLLYQSLGVSHKALEAYDSAIWYFNQGMQYATEKGYREQFAGLKLRLGNLYLEQEDFQRALKCYKESLSIFTEIGNQPGVTESLALIARVHYSLGDNEKAIAVASEGLPGAVKSGLRVNIADLAEVLYQASEIAGDYPNAFGYLKMYQQYNDSINQALNEKELLAYTSRVEIQKLQDDNLELVNQNEQSRNYIERQNTFLIGGAVLIVLLVGITYLLFLYYISRKRSLKLLEQKNEEIAVQAKELIAINASLEQKVKRRTARILAQNEKLREYAFSNAHVVRAPLARILGLTDNLLDEQSVNHSKEFLDSMKSSALELDDAIRGVSKILAEEDVKDPIK